MQIDVAGTADLPQAAADRLAAVLHTETGKPVSFRAGRRLAGHGQQCWSQQDIKAAGDANRQVHTGGTIVTLYVLSLDATSCDDANIVGLAYGASNMLVYTAAARRAAPATVSPERIVEAVIIHELGHILGLVNVGYRSPTNHEDTDHPGHSSNPKSVMYWQLERGNLIQQLVAGPPLTFDSNDEADLAAVRDGKL